MLSVFRFYIVLLFSASTLPDNIIGNSMIEEEMDINVKMLPDVVKLEEGQPPQSMNMKYSPRNIRMGSAEHKIMGGQETELREASFLVSLLIFDGNGFSHKCGGSICDKNHVITGAYCVDGVQASEILVLSGTDCLNSSDPGQSISLVDNIRTHEEYDKSNAYYDVAILTIIGEFDFGCFLPTVRQPIPITLMDTPAGKDCKGYMNEPGEYEGITLDNFPNCLRRIEVKVVNWKTCYNLYKGVFTTFPEDQSPVTEHQLCATGDLQLGGQDVCYGDEGTSLVCDGQLVGIASYGFGCGRPYKPAVYTSVFPLLPWIAKNGCPLCPHHDLFDDKKSAAVSPKVTGNEEFPTKNEL